MSQVISKPGSGSGGGGGGSGDIESVTASTGLTGGGTSGAVTLALSGGSITSLGKADTAIQPGVASIVAADISATAAILKTQLAGAVQTSLGKADTAVQPNTSATLSGLTVTGFSGVVKAAVGVLSAATILNADIDAAAAIDGSKITAVTATVAGVVPAITGAGRFLRANDAGTAVIYSTILVGSITSGSPTISIVPAVSTSGSPNALLLTSAAHTTLAASTEASDVLLDCSATAQFATGAIATLRTVRIRNRTYGAVGASVVTTGATLAIDDAPTAGSNVSYTNKFALLCSAGDIGLLTPSAKLRGFSTIWRDLLSITSGDTIQLGGSAAVIQQLVGASVVMQISSTLETCSVATRSFASTVVTPKINQTVDATATVTGDQFCMSAQDCSGTTAVTAGKMVVRGGNATGASGTRNGGAIDIQVGNGVTAGGLGRLTSGNATDGSGTQMLAWNATGLALFTATPVAQPADLGAPSFATAGDAQTWCAALRTNVLRALGATA